MKSKISKEYLTKAISHLPDEFAFNEIRSYMKQALNKLVALEEKKEKKLQLISQPIVSNNLQPQNINALDQMIHAEKQNLEKILQRKKSDDNNLQTIFG